MSRITRKELKSDKFALEVEHSITFFEEHQKEITRYGGIVLAVAVLIAGYVVYSRHEHTAREQALSAAIRVQEAPVGISGNGGLAFPTQEAKDQESLRVFSDLQSKYSGSAEGEIAQYYLGAVKADQGKLAEAEKLFAEVAEKGDAKYSSLAKLSLAQIYFGDGRDAQGEKVLRDLMDHPTEFVSKEQATISLARFLAPKKPAEARKLLEPLRTQPGAVSQVALTLIGELPPQ
ncbi:MAG TPA: tetratricopeptide repeat protein [Candidatus Acidoferrales bacterium]|nr:tetratricopeptide repeat protein [Candidatus Acidoferrales bacterium]